MTDGQSDEKMTRKVKDPDARREEFLSVASDLFNERGYESTSVDEIVNRVGVAKGLFYYYFESKEELLERLIDRYLDEAHDSVMAVSLDQRMSALEKMEALLGVSRKIRSESKALVTYFHRPQNRYLHLDLERKMLQHVIPILEGIINQGVREGVFHTENPQETAIAYLATASALGHGVEGKDRDEIMRLIVAFQEITERLFGAEKGTFDMYGRILARSYEDADKQASGRTDVS